MAECKRLREKHLELRVALERLRAKIAAIREWSHVYGAQLRPESTNSADTYGEGVRACKQAVLKLVEVDR